MEVKKIIAITILMLASLVSVGCFAESQSQNDDGFRGVKEEPIVTLSREQALIGFLQNFDVLVNDIKVSEISNNSYIRLKLGPGRYKISVKPGMGAFVATTNIEVSKESIYLEWSMPLGILSNTFFIGSRIESRTAEDMEKILAKSRLMQGGDLIDFAVLLAGAKKAGNEVDIPSMSWGLHSNEKFPASGFAGLDDVLALPVGGQCRKHYENWLLQKPPKAFAVGLNKGCGFTWGMQPKTPGDSTIPAERVITACERTNGTCVLYAVDDRVVYKKQD